MKEKLASMSTEKTKIELEPRQTAIVLNDQGQVAEIYLPDLPDDEEVPQPIIDILNYLFVKRGADHMSDKGYKLGSHEEQQEFDRKRNFEWDNWKPIE
jgi:hypothetical protein